MSVWQPIETAPKDRAARLLIGRYPGGRNWTDVYSCWWESGLYGRLRGGWARWPHEFQPTHWMPLPEPPAQD